MRDKDTPGLGGLLGLKVKAHLQWQVSCLPSGVSEFFTHQCAHLSKMRVLLVVGAPRKGWHCWPVDHKWLQDLSLGNPPVPPCPGGRAQHPEALCLGAGRCRAWAALLLAAPLCEACRHFTSMPLAPWFPHQESRKLGKGDPTLPFAVCPSPLPFSDPSQRHTESETPASAPGAKVLGVQGLPRLNQEQPVLTYCLHARHVLRSALHLQT